MKKFFSLLLTMMFLYLSLTGCTEGEVSLSESSASQEPSANVQERKYQVIIPGRHVEDGWNSPTGMIPNTTEALDNYYEEHPDFADYYYDYLVPINFMLGNTWGNGQAAPTHSMELWSYFELTEEEKEKYIRNVDFNNNGAEYLILDREIVERKALETFGLSEGELRDDESYYEEYKGYLHMGIGLGQQPVYVIDEVEEEEGRVAIIYRRTDNFNFPEVTESMTSADQTFRLMVEFKMDGSCQYTSCEEI